MPVPAFHQYRDAAVRAVDRVMAETLRLYPLRDGKADPDRSGVDVEAPLRSGAAKENTVTSGNSWSGRIASGEAQAHISRVAYPDLVVREGDRLRAVDRAGQPFFTVASVDDRHHSRLILELDEA